MDIKYKELLKDQIIFVILPILAVGGLCYGIYLGGNELSKDTSEYIKQSTELTSQLQAKNQLEKRVAEQKAEVRDPDLKQVLELKGVNFGTEASFAPLFDNVIDVAKATGIRIRSVRYDYAPSGDPIFASKLKNYNVCELTATVVGKYSEIQSFLKTLLNERYLIGLSHVEIVSWRRDKTILIANLKIRFYTRTT
ncbi:MAG: hypothetical protein LUE64_00245 [Candidatus Gastranaerophilales bacterium]|nr:hypothetical protein [Candidatus Gastranaerophilales bacterium]